MQMITSVFFNSNKHFTHFLHLCYDMYKRAILMF